MGGAPLIASGPAGVVVDVHVIPRAARSGIAGLRDGALLVRLNAPPVEGTANVELIAVIAKAFGVPRRAVMLISGERSRRKRIRVLGVSAAQVADILATHTQARSSGDE